MILPNLESYPSAISAAMDAFGDVETVDKPAALPARPATLGPGHGIPLPVAGVDQLTAEVRDCAPAAAQPATHIRSENSMADQHQVNSIIATAIFDCRKDDPDRKIDPEEAKQMAKCIVEALTDAGLQIAPVSKA